MSDIATQYENGLIEGWAGETVAKEEFSMLKTSDTFVPFTMSDLPKADRKMFLHNLVKKVIGGFTDNYPQLTGDCTAFAAKNVGEYLSCVQIALGQRAKFKYLFPPYVYACERVIVGKGRLGRSAGGVGSWVAETLCKYGQIAKDIEGCPEYSQQIADKWGYQGAPNKFLEIGKENICKVATKVTNWDQAVTLVCNGSPIEICSNRGFEMKSRSDGFNYPSGVWNHAMTLISVDDTYKKPYGIILNSWGPNAHSALKDFETGEDLPPGCFRASADVINGMLSQDDSFGYAGMTGFVEQYEDLKRELFKMI